MNVPENLPTAARNGDGPSDNIGAAISSNRNITGSTRRRLIADAEIGQQSNNTNDVADGSRDRHQCDGRVFNMEPALFHD